MIVLLHSAYSEFFSVEEILIFFLKSMESPSNGTEENSNKQ